MLQGVHAESTAADVERRLRKLETVETCGELGIDARRTIEVEQDSGWRWSMKRREASGYYT